MAVIPSAGRYGLATDEWLLPQALKQVGYQTAIVGKWHLGHIDKKYWPAQRGFDYSYGPLIGEIDHFKHESHGVTDWYRNNKPVSEPAAPHTPYQAPQSYLDRYKDISDPLRRAYAARSQPWTTRLAKSSTPSKSGRYAAIRRSFLLVTTEARVQISLSAKPQ
jgi:arylsulfatase A-like enzyme